jgi:dephospho-CoA kinase
MIIGLTGSIGSGKSEVAGILGGFGVFVIDADRVSHRLTAKGEVALGELVSIFGKEILKKNGSLNRRVLGKIVFDDIVARKKVEEILHTLILSHIRDLACQKCSHSDIVIDAPLLFETGLNKICDKTIVVWTPTDIQFARLAKAKKFSKEQIEKRINAQMPIDKKMKLADFVIDNSGSKAQLFKNTKALFAHLKSISN